MDYMPRYSPQHPEEAAKSGPIDPKKPSEDTRSPSGTPFEIPVPPAMPDSLPVIRSWDRFCHTGSVDDYLSYKSIEGGGARAPQNPRNRTGADAVWFPGQNADPAHF